MISLQDVDLTHSRINKIENLEVLFQVEVRHMSESCDFVLLMIWATVAVQLQTLVSFTVTDKFTRMLHCLQSTADVI